VLGLGGWFVGVVLVFCLSFGDLFFVDTVVV